MFFYVLSQVGSINLMRLSAATPYAFGLAVVDVLFTKEELASSLLFSSKKSPKPALDHKRVENPLSKYLFSKETIAFVSVHVLPQITTVNREIFELKNFRKNNFRVLNFS